MGLAASQARFLNLTARKTNIEYEAQQINQQRTTLANQSANTYNQMLTLSVPTPPSEAAFQTVTYSFSYNGDPAIINQVVKSKDGDFDYKVSITYTQTEDKIANNNTLVVKKDAEGNAYYNGTKLVSLSSISDDKLDKEAVKEAIKDIVSTISSVNDIMVAVKGSDEIPTYTYFLKEDVDNIPTEEGKNKKEIASFKEQEVTTHNHTVLAADINRDANNRITSLTYDNVENAVVTATTTKDTVAYEDAYNEYTYQTYLYQQQMERINAQTSVIQAQDKKLELRLKQLDTEQNAIKTEMESVSSVVKKNVEDTFKIFA